MHQNLDVVCGWALFKASLVWRLRQTAIWKGQNYQIMGKKGLKGIIIFRILLASLPKVKANCSHLQSAEMAASVLNALITQTKGDARLFIPGQR